MVSTVTVRLTLLAALTVLMYCSVQVNCQLEDTYSHSSDYQSMSNTIYDIDAARSHHHRDRDRQSNNNNNNNQYYEYMQRAQTLQNSDPSEVDNSNSINYSQQNKFQATFPKRLSIKVEDDNSNFQACGGFSGGTGGTCCSACAKMNYKEGCWCRTWDCLCFNS